MRHGIYCGPAVISRQPPPMGRLVRAPHCHREIKRIISPLDLIFRVDVFRPSIVPAKPGVERVKAEIVVAVLCQLVLVARLGVRGGGIRQRAEMERLGGGEGQCAVAGARIAVFGSVGLRESITASQL